MIDNVLGLLSRRLNEHFANTDPRAEDWVILANMADHAGQMFEDNRDKMVMSLVSIQHETVVSTYNRVKAVADSYAAVAPPVYIDIQIMLMANFYNKNYAVGLRMISKVISFFQQNPSFSHAELPDLDPEVDKLTMSLVNMTAGDCSHLLGMMGAKYLPVVFYKLRMLSFRGPAIQAVVQPMRGPAVGK